MLAALKARFNGADDFCLRELTAGGQVLYALFLDGMTSGSDISDFVVRPLMENLRPGTPEELYAQAQRGAVWCAVCEEADSAEAAADKLTHGYCVVVFPGLAKALCFEAKSGTRRGPSAPESENTVKGAKDAFTETIRINTALVRRHLRTPELRLASKTVGRRTQTNVTVCSIAGLTDPKLVARMEKRLSRIDIDGLLSPAAVEEYVTGSRRTAFPLLQYTERTDQFCQGLLEGQVGLLVDGLKVSGKTISWDAPALENTADDAVKFVVYRFDSVEAINLNDPAAIEAITWDHQWKAERAGVYVVTALSRVNCESVASEPVIVK